MADHDDDLSQRFGELESIPAPGWRDRIDVSGELELDPPVEGHAAWPRALALAAMAAVVLLVIGIVAWPDDDSEPLVAGPAAGFGDLPPTDKPLVCPPALLDVGDLFADVVPPPTVVYAPASPDGGPTPYLLRWEQEGREITLAYPHGFAADLLIAYPTEVAALGDGRKAILEYGERLGADVSSETTDPYDKCTSFSISVSGDGDFVEPPITEGGPPAALPPVTAPPPPGACASDRAGVTVDDASSTTPSSSVIPPATQPVRDFILRIARTVHVRPPEGAVEVPEVAGLGVVEAQDRLARAGLVPDGDAPVTTAFEDRPVSALEPAPGTVVPIGTPVCVKVEPLTTTTTAPPPPVEDPVVPVPDVPIVCPIGRVELSGGVTSQPRVAFGHTVEWLGPEQTDVQLSWPNESFDDGGHRARALTVNGRPALMHDGGDGQNLVFDTGLGAGQCRFMEVGVYGGMSVERREELAVELATDLIRIRPPSGAVPDVVGLSLADAADALARAGFIADWGHHPGIGDEPIALPSATVSEQQPPDDLGIVVLDL